MGKESQIDALNLSPLAQRKIQELVALLADEYDGLIEAMLRREIVALHHVALMGLSIDRFRTKRNLLSQIGWRDENGARMGPPQHHN